MTATASCSFCRKPSDEVRKLVAGPGVFICDRCIALAVQVTEGEPVPGTAVAPWETELPLNQVLDILAPVAAAAAQVERHLGIWVGKARELGATWAQIGTALGITRQSAWERFSAEK